MKLSSTFAKVSMGFIVGATTVGGIATAAVTLTSSTTVVCADNRTGALYSMKNGACSSARTALALATGQGSIKNTVAKVSPSI